MWAPAPAPSRSRWRSNSARRVIATDLSLAACAVARSNAATTAARTSEFIEADLLRPFADGIADVVVSNPPYVRSSRSRIAAARSARLGAGIWRSSAARPALAIYERLIPEARRVLKPGGMLALELGFGQAEAVSALASGWRNLQLFPDLAGIPRVLVCEKP